MLSAPSVARTPLHTRAVTFRGYAREDGLWELEGELHDSKHYDYVGHHKPIPAGTPVHHLFLRVTVDEHFRIRDIETSMQSTPLPECPSAAGAMKRMIGQTLGPGWRQTIERTIGGVQGCTHLRELLFNLATVAFQTIPHARQMLHREAGLSREEAESAEPPFYMGQCMAWDFNGPAVARLAPRFVGWLRPERKKAQDAS